MDLNTQQEVHLSHYWNVIRKRWKVAAAILIVVMAGAFLFSYFSKPLYRSVIQLQIDREASGVSLQEVFGIAASQQEFLQTQYILLRSRGLAERVVDDHKLYNDREIYPPGVAGKTPEEIEKIQEGIARSLLGGIRVSPVVGTSLVEISYVGTSPRVAQKVAEAWGDSFIQMSMAQKLESVQHASNFLARQIAIVEADLDQSREQLQAYGRSRGILPVGEGNPESATMQKLTQLNTDVTAAQGVVFQKQAAYTALQ